MSEQLKPCPFCRAELLQHPFEKEYWFHPLGRVVETVEAAARAYDAKALELYGEFAWLNFPPKDHVQYGKAE